MVSRSIGSLRVTSPLFTIHAVREILPFGACSENRFNDSFRDTDDAHVRLATPDAGPSFVPPFFTAVRVHLSHPNAGGQDKNFENSRRYVWEVHALIW